MKTIAIFNAKWQFTNIPNTSPHSIEMDPNRYKFVLYVDPRLLEIIYNSHTSIAEENISWVYTLSIR